jgi:hypothetical protein
MSTKKKRYLVTTKTGRVFTRASFREYTHALVHVWNGNHGLKKDGEHVTFHGSIANAKPKSWLIDCLSQTYTVEIKGV